VAQATVELVWDDFNRRSRPRGSREIGKWGELSKSYPGKISGTGKMPIPENS